MIIHLVGIGSDTFVESMDSTGIDYKFVHPRYGEPQNGGDVLEIILGVLGPVSVVLVAWLNAKPSRKAIITTKDDVVIHVEGRSVKEVGDLLNNAKSIIVMETSPPKREANKTRHSNRH